MPFSTLSYMLIFVSTFVDGIIFIVRGAEHQAFTWIIDGVMLVWAIPLAWALLRERNAGALNSQQAKIVGLVAGLAGVACLLIGIIR